MDGEGEEEEEISAYVNAYVIGSSGPLPKRKNKWVEK